MYIWLLYFFCLHSALYTCCYNFANFSNMGSIKACSCFPLFFPTSCGGQSAFLADVQQGRLAALKDPFFSKRFAVMWGWLLPCRAALRWVGGCYHGCSSFWLQDTRRISRIKTNLRASAKIQISLVPVKKTSKSCWIFSFLSRGVSPAESTRNLPFFQHFSARTEMCCVPPETLLDYFNQLQSEGSHCCLHTHAGASDVQPAL